MKDRRGAVVTPGCYVIWVDNTSRDTSGLYRVLDVKKRVKIELLPSCTTWVNTSSVFVVNSIPHVAGWRENTDPETKVRPHEIWEFGWSQPYTARHNFIQTLPENEREWATAVFHYIDAAFEFRMMDYLNRGNVTQDSVGDLREYIKDSLEPPTDDTWKHRFLPEDGSRWHRKEDEHDEPRGDWSEVLPADHPDARNPGIG